MVLLRLANEFTVEDRLHEAVGEPELEEPGEGDRHEEFAASRGETAGSSG
jgi:hypothetical protein